MHNINNTVFHVKSGEYTGFCGNVMFQTSAAIGIAVKNNLNYCFPEKKEFSFFKGPIPTGYLVNTPAVNYNEQGYHYSPVNITQGQNYNLTGYYQSVKYWEHCESLIKKLFTFNDTIQKTVYDKYAHVFNDTLSQRVSIHVRRGDYLKHPDEHPVLPMSYYIKAATMLSLIIPSNHKFVIFSDDIAWCKQNFTDPIFKDKLIFAEDNGIAEDMYFMSQCAHNILANSSFSWWGSYLNANPFKMVMAPAKNMWYGKNYAHWNLDDMYLPTWTIIEL